MDYYWRIMALIGAILFSVSGFLPVYVDSRGIVYEYQYVGSENWSGSFAVAPVSTLGFLLLVILWPIALVLGIVSIFKRKTALVAGIFGIICWAGAVMYDSAYLSGGMQYGAGVYMGFVAAALVLVTYYLKPKQAAPPTSPQPFAPPPPPPQATTPLCPTCGQPLVYAQQYGRWYCYTCKEYR